MTQTQNGRPEANGTAGEQVGETNPEVTVLDAAQYMATRGAYVFPLDHPALPQCAGVPTKGHDPTTCAERGKHPTGRWSIEATNKLADIVAMFAGTTRNYGIDCRASQLLVIDEDVLGLFTDYAAQHGHTIPHTFIVRSGRPGGGRHFYFRVPREHPFTNSTGNLPKGVDVRGKGGYVVGPGSLHASGQVYLPEDWAAPFADLPDWLAETLTPPARQHTEVVDGEPLNRPLTPRVAELLDADPGDRSEQFYRLARELMEAGFTQGQAVTVLTPWCDQHDKYVGRVAVEVARCWSKPSSAPPPSRVLAVEGDQAAERPALDVGNPAIMADWLRYNVGTGLLAGMFTRGPDIVHTPREGENGYVPLDDNPDNNDGPAQVRVASYDYISARVQYTFNCFKLVKQGKAPDVTYVPTPALFPTAAARTATNAVDMLPNLRRLRGVIHTPVFRPDGSLLDVPGYDLATKLLYLPEPGLALPAVSERPSPREVKAAVALLDELLAGFPFVSPHHRANYIGGLVTPLLRTLTPPPYKLLAIGAHQRGSGKTKLAKVAQIIHGGVFRSEMPEDEAELRKQVTSVLSHTTGPVVVFDNVSGVLRSSTMAGLLTSDQWGDRPLGATAWVGVPNDRLWVITGNNLNLGGDIPRRTISADIDPGVPRPELRTGFAIGDPEVWARMHRPQLLHALLTVVQAWVVAGMPLPPERASDGYARWTRAVEGILTFAEVGGIFDHASTQVEVGGDDDEWADFLAAAYRVKGDRMWTAKELLTEVNAGTFATDQRPIQLDALPGELADKAARSGNGPVGITRSLGKWLQNRDGRWAGSLTVRAAGKDRDGTKKWRIQAAPGHTATPSAGDAGDAGSNPAHLAHVKSDDLDFDYGDRPKHPPHPPHPPHLPLAGLPAGVERADPNYCLRCQQTYANPAVWADCDRCGTRTHVRGRGGHGPTCQTCLSERNAA
ncbi:bifunctional DNA primase/polymerase [Micromonospora ureilytica]|uniref:DNA primase/polymerase bifunctional N-terminal domain-containing protein n=1 Tax=Micromonospora ureilytica TaxID=709868 RepID=A0ABS0JSQ2_9ACTN|nr:bifunctional DNA primase/polymerase [Micromonospora ureilytica]MBG6070070.1 hypothetical protein [Micromonospora ureilytica]